MLSRRKRKNDNSFTPPLFKHLRGIQYKKTSASSVPGSNKRRQKRKQEADADADASNPTLLSACFLMSSLRYYSPPTPPGFLFLFLFLSDMAALSDLSQDFSEQLARREKGEPCWAMMSPQTVGSRSSSIGLVDLRGFDVFQILGSQKYRRYKRGIISQGQKKEEERRRKKKKKKKGPGAFGGIKKTEGQFHEYRKPEQERRRRRRAEERRRRRRRRRRRAADDGYGGILLLLLIVFFLLLIATTIIFTPAISTITTSSIAIAIAISISISILSSSSSSSSR
jgi:hypothetical protein